jgi:hypothetical protein
MQHEWRNSFSEAGKSKVKMCQLHWSCPLELYIMLYVKKCGTAKSDFCHSGILILVQRWDKRVNALGHYVER